MSPSPNRIFAINHETNLPIRDVLVDIANLLSQPLELCNSPIGYFVQSSEPGFTRGRANALSVAGGVVNRSVVNQEQHTRKSFSSIASNMRLEQLSCHQTRVAELFTESKE